MAKFELRLFDKAGTWNAPTLTMKTIYKFVFSISLGLGAVPKAAALTEPAEIMENPFEKNVTIDPEVKNLFCRDLRSIPEQKNLEVSNRMCGYFKFLHLVEWEGRKKDSHSKPTVASNSLDSKNLGFYSQPAVQAATKDQLNEIKKTMAEFCCQDNETCRKAFAKVGTKFCSDSSAEKCETSYVHYDLEEDGNLLNWWNMNLLTRGREALLPTIQTHRPHLIGRLGEIAPGTMVMPENQYVDDPFRQNFLFVHELGHACLSIKAQIHAGEPNMKTFRPSEDDGGASCQFGKKDFHQFSVLKANSKVQEYQGIRNCIQQAIDQEYFENLKQQEPSKICYGSKFEETMADAITILSSPRGLTGVLIDTMCRTLSDEVHVKGESLLKCLFSNSSQFRSKLAKDFQCE